MSADTITERANIVHYATGVAEKKAPKTPLKDILKIPWVVGKPKEDTAQREADILASLAPEGKTMDQNKFLQQEGTGVRMNEKGQRIEGQSSNEVTISAGLTDQYKTFLERYVSNLQDIKGNQPNFDNTVLSTPSHAHDRKIYDLLTNNGKLKPGTPAFEAHVNEFVGREENIILTQELIDHQTELKMFALALKTTLEPGGSRSLLAEEGTIKLGIDQGTLNKIWVDQLYPKIKDFFTANNNVRGMPDQKTLKSKFEYYIANSVSAVNLGTIVALLTHSAPLTYGTDIAAFIALNKGINSIITDGVTLEQQRCGAMLDAIKANPAEAEYVRIMMGIDVNDYTHTPGKNDITLVPGRTPQSTGIEILKTEVLSSIYTRLQYHAEIGVPLEATDALPSQSLASGLASHEQVRTRANIREQQIYQDFMNRYGVSLPANATEQQQQAYTRQTIELRTMARVEFMNELVRNEEFRKLAEEQERKEDQLAQDLQDRLVARRENGTLTQKEVDKLSAEQNSLRDIDTVLQTESAQLLRFTENDQATEAADSAVKAKLTELGLNTLPDFDSAIRGLNLFTTISKQDVFGGGIVLKIDGENIGQDSINYQLNEIAKATRQELTDHRANTLYPLESEFRTKTDALTNATEALTENSEAIEDYRKTVKETNTTLQAQSSQTEIDAQTGRVVQKLIDPEVQKKLADTIKDAHDQINTLRNARPQLKIAATTARSELEDVKKRLAPETQKEADLVAKIKTQTESPQNDPKTKDLDNLRSRIKDELDDLKKLVAAYNKEKQDAKNRLQSDNNLKAADKLKDEYNTQLTLLTTIQTDATHALPAGAVFPGISEDDLRKLSVDDLLDRVNLAHSTVDPTANNAPNPIPGTWDKLENTYHRNQIIHAKVEAIAKEIAGTNPITVAHRVEAMEKYRHKIEIQVYRLEAQKGTINYKKETDQINMAIQLNNRRAEIANSNATSQLLEITLQEAGIDQPVAANTPGISLQEQQTIQGHNYANESKFYFEILNKLTGYQDAADRGSEFMKWAQVLTPQRLMTAINAEILIPNGYPPVTSLDQSVQHINVLFLNGKIGSDTMRHMLKNITLNEIQRARALPV